MFLIPMLIAFSVENFRSIRDLQTFSMEEPRADDHLEWSNVFAAGKRRLLKSAVIYGPNAAGKSNLIRAMIWFREFILNSSKDTQAGEPIAVEPFRLSTLTEFAPSHFEAEFSWQGFDYRYGFTVTAKQVESEWLFRKQPDARPARLFTREGGAIDVSSEFFKEGKGLEERTRPNALFLSVCGQFNGPESTRILEWVRRVRSISGLDEAGFLGFTAKRLEQAEHRAHLLDLARKADFNITALRSEIEEMTEDRLPKGLSGAVRQRLLQQKIYRADIKTAHNKRDADGKVVGQVEFDLAEDESQGTRKFIAISGPITHTLEEGSILIVDELDARLHPKLAQALIDLFHSPVNRKNAQLICAAHDVSLMEPERFRRDQVWLCEKDEADATRFYALAEFDPQKMRANTKFARQYMMGLLGAVPRLAHFEDAAEHAVSS